MECLGVTSVKRAWSSGWGQDVGKMDKGMRDISELGKKVVVLGEVSPSLVVSGVLGSFWLGSGEFVAPKTSRLLLA